MIYVCISFVSMHSVLECKSIMILDVHMCSRKKSTFYNAVEVADESFDGLSLAEALRAEFDYCILHPTMDYLLTQSKRMIHNPH